MKNSKYDFSSISKLRWKSEIDQMLMKMSTFYNTLVENIELQDRSDEQGEA